MATIAYEELVAVDFTDSQFSWNSTDYSRLLLDSGVTIPSGVSLDSYIESGVGVDGTAIHSGTDVFAFIVPNPYEVLSVISGTIQGNVKMGVRVPSGTDGNDSLTITKVEIQLLGLADSGDTSTLLDYTEVWSGSLSQTGEGTSTKSFMFWQSVADAKIESAERLVINIRLTWNSEDWYNNDNYPFYIQLYTGKDAQDTMFVLPFVMG